MSNIQKTKRKMIWIDGNTLVRVVGEQEAREYLHGNGYQSKLTKFIEERERKLREEEKLRKDRRRKPIEKEVEPSL